jgi:hypothetical protein
MRIIGFKLDKILAERFKDPKGNLTVNSNFKLDNITRKKELETKDPVFSFEFVYTMDYDDVAKVEFKGIIFAEVDDKKLAKEFEKENNVTDSEARKVILDFLLFKTHVESLHLEEKLGLPFHVQSPRVNFEGK